MTKFPVSTKKEEDLILRMAALGIREDDLLEKFILSSGPGGQNLQKTASCVYLKHLPSGIEVKCQKERSQGLNRFFARRILCDLYEEKELGRKSPLQLKKDKARKQKLRRKRKSLQKQGDRE